MDPARDGPPRPGHRPPLNSPESARLEVSESTTSLTGESRSDATDAVTELPDEDTLRRLYKQTTVRCWLVGV